jgi:hypothetical protein
VDEGEAGLGQHGLGEPGDAAHHVQADTHVGAEPAQFADEVGDRGRPVLELAVNVDDALGVDGSNSVYLLGDVDPDADVHITTSRLVDLRPPAHAVFALHSDGSQSLISGRDGLATPGEMPPEPLRAASMKTIPAPPPSRDPGMPGSRRQPLFSQLQKDRAV